MLNQTTSTNQASRLNNAYQPIERVFYRLRELNQIQDESRNELCPVFSDQQSHRQSRRQSNWSQQLNNHHNVLKDLQETDGIESKQQLDWRKSTAKASNNDDLRTANHKLRQDNVKLFQECIKLKKQLQLYETEVSGFHKKAEEEEAERVREEQVKLERVARELDNANRQVQALVNCKQQLEKELENERRTNTFQKQELRSKALQLDELIQHLDSIRQVNRDLKAKVTQLQRQLEQQQLRRASKSTSLNSTSQESRKDSDKDRMISNLKLVHQSQIRKLKGTIQQLKKQNGKDRR